MFRDSDCAEDREEPKSTSGGLLSIFSKVTRSCLEVGCARNRFQFHTVPQNPNSLDAGLRMDGIPAPDLLDLVMEVFHSSPNREARHQTVGDAVGPSRFRCQAPQAVTEEHQVLLHRIPRVRDLHSAWLLLLHSASARANCFFRVVDPGSSADFARAHDDDIGQYTCDILHADPVQARSVKDVASLPLVLCDLELRRVSVLGELDRLHPNHPRTSPCGGRCVGPASWRVIHTHHVCVPLPKPLGFCMASWGGARLRDGTRPETRQFEEYEPGSTRGWQHEAASRVDQRFRNEDFARLTDSGQVLVREGGPGVGLALSHLSHEDRTLELFRVISSPPSINRAFLPVWPSTRRLWPPLLALGLGSWERGSTLWRR